MMKIQNFLYQFLRKTQKYTGTDNVYLAKGGFWLTLGSIASSAVAFLMAIAFANLLSPSTYGNYKYILSLVGILGIFSLTGIRTAVAQATARGLEGSFYTGFKTQLKWGILLSFAATGMSLYYWLRGNEFLPIPLLIIAVFLPLMMASRVYVGILTGRKLFYIQTKYNIINQIVFAAIIITALFFTKNLLWLITAYIVSHTFLTYFFYLITKLKFKPNKKEDPKTLSFGIHLSLMEVVGKAASYLDQILLFTLVGSSQLAIYAFAIILPEQIKSTLGNIQALASPKLAAKSRTDIRKTIMQKVKKLFFLSVVIIILYIVIAPYFYRIFFPQYINSVLYSQVFILSLVAVPGSLLSMVFQAKMMKKELYLLRIIPVVRIILFVALIPFYGIWGAIMALVGASIFGVGLTLFLFRKF